MNSRMVTLRGRRDLAEYGSNYGIFPDLEVITIEPPKLARSRQFNRLQAAIKLPKILRL